MSLIVQKYGGTSVGTPERIRHVARRISRFRDAGHRLLVVVSAMGHTTDELIDLAHQVSHSPPHREMDMLLTAGERISTALLSMALADLNIPALSLTGSQTGIITDPSHRRARIQKILGDRARAALDQNKVVIVAGFQGVSETKEITTLGRGGSDTSAVALAAALHADQCEIYTDVDGVYSADPRLVKAARLWRVIPQDLMVEMATCGAGVLHPRSVELAKQYGVSLWVKNSLNENEGTAVMPRDLAIKQKSGQGMEDFAIVGVTSDPEKVLISVELSESETALQSVWGKAGDAHLSIVAPLFSDRKAKFFSEKEAEQDWHRILGSLKADGTIQSYRIDLDCVPLSMVGDRFSESRAIAQIFNVLQRQGIPILMSTASALTVTVGVARSQADAGVKALHAEFLEEAKGVTK